MVFEKVSYAYNDGVASYQINYKGYQFLGVAQCHSEDMDFANERVGLTIAEARAVLKVLRFVRDTEVAQQIKILKHLYTFTFMLSPPYPCSHHPDLFCFSLHDDCNK